MSTTSSDLPTNPSHPSTTKPSPTQPSRALRIGTRSSTLALAQVSLFTSLLSTNPSAHLSSLPTTTTALSTSLGDTNKVTALHTLASTGKSLWTESLEAELQAGTVDILIHSLKDVPTKLPVGLKVRAVGTREAEGDVVLLSPRVKARGVTRLSELPDGGRVGTSSVRRAAMIRRQWKGLRVVDCRGNVPTRIRKLEAASTDSASEGGVGEEGGGEFDAIILAAAGVKRLGLEEKVDEWLGWGTGMGHAVGQGALGVEWREGDEWVEEILEQVEKETGSRGRWEGEAERGLLRVLEGGCSVPVGVECSWDQEGLGEPKNDENTNLAHEPEGIRDQAMDTRVGKLGYLTLKAMVVSVDGGRCVHGEQRIWVSNDREAEECGIATARQLVEHGAEEILKDIELNRGMLKDMDNA